MELKPASSPAKGRIAFVVATFAGSGLSPVAPGTAGSLAALLPFLWIGSFHWAYQLAVIVAVLAAGTWAANRAEDRFGAHDDGRIVIDEVAGQWITLFAFPVTLPVFVLGFGLFRLFDILKPWPANWIDRKVGGGWGVMLDDVVAGIYAHAVLRALLRIWNFL